MRYLQRSRGLLSRCGVIHPDDGASNCGRRDRGGNGGMLREPGKCEFRSDKAEWPVGQNPSAHDSPEVTALDSDRMAREIARLDAAVKRLEVKVEALMLRVDPHAPRPWDAPPQVPKAQSPREGAPIATECNGRHD